MQVMKQSLWIILGLVGLSKIINSQQQQPVETLDWITPLETGIYEYPLVNEVVIVSFYMDRAYYSRRLNSRNFINNSADFKQNTDMV